MVISLQIPLMACFILSALPFTSPAEAEPVGTVSSQLSLQELNAKAAPSNPIVMYFVIECLIYLCILYIIYMCVNLEFQIYA